MLAAALALQNHKGGRQTLHQTMHAAAQGYSNTSAAMTSHSDDAATSAIFCFRYSTARFEFSTKTTRRAPRLKASIPRLPLPAKRSSTSDSPQSTRFCKILNTELLTLLVAGRTDKSATVRSCLPLVPPGDNAHAYSALNARPTADVYSCLRFSMSR